MIVFGRDKAGGDVEDPWVIDEELRYEPNFVSLYDGYSPPVVFPSEVWVSYGHRCECGHPMSSRKREWVVFWSDHR